MYGKITDGILETLRLPIVIDGKKVWTSDKKTLGDLGWKQVVRTPRPASGEGATYVSQYQETETEIRQTWVKI